MALFRRPARRAVPQTLEEVAVASQAAARVRELARELARALDDAEAAGLALGVHVTPALGEREGWRIDVQGAGW